MNPRLLSAPLLVFGTLAAAACSTPSESQSSEEALVDDIKSMKRLPDGRFAVVCSDHREEIVTSADITSGKVCAPLPPVVDPTFAPCDGANATYAELVAKVPRGASQVSLGRFTGKLEQRSCTGQGCSPFEDLPSGASTFAAAPPRSFDIWGPGKSPFYTNEHVFVGMDGEAALFVRYDGSIELRLRSDSRQYGYQRYSQWGAQCELKKRADGSAEVGSCSAFVNQSKWDLDAWIRGYDWFGTPSFPAEAPNVYGSHDGRQRVVPAQVKLTKTCVSFVTASNETQRMRWGGRTQ